MPQLSFHPGFNGVLLLCLAGAAFVLVWIFYRSAFRTLKLSAWLSLYALRMATIVIVLLLLFRPVLSFEKPLSERPSLIFLLDNSASMSIADNVGGDTRFEGARNRLLDWESKLKQDFQLHLITFSDSPLRIKDFRRLADMEASGKATSLSRALREVRRATNTPTAVFLISDGIHNSAGDPLREAAQLGVPVNTVGSGNVLRDRQSFRDVRLAGLECPDQMAVGNRVRLSALVDAVGLPGRVLQVVFEENGEPIAEQEVVLDDLDGMQTVIAEFVPAKKGLHTYRASIAALAEEKIPQNNHRVASALVVDARMRVLYIEGTLRAEYGALVGRFLAKDPNIEYCALVQTRPNVFVQRTNIDGLKLRSIPEDADFLAAVNVFLIGDLDSSYLRPRQMELIQQRVKQGAGLLMMGGYHSLGPGGYQGTIIESILPVEVGDREIGQIAEPFAITLTPDGRRHPIFANIADFFATKNQQPRVAGLPPLSGCVRVRATKPGATVLALHPGHTVEGDLPMPVLAVQRVGDGRTAVFTGDTTRNWHQTLRSMDRESPFLRFWGQTVRWLAGRSEDVETEAGLTATTNKSYYEPESKITINGTVRGDEGQGVGDAVVTATIENELESTSLRLVPQPGPAGNYRAEYEPLIAGKHEIHLEASWNDRTLKSEKLLVNVGRPNLEFDRLDLDQRMLVNIASRTGGSYVHLTTADRLLERIQQRRQQRRVTLEVPVAWPPACWLLFVGLITTEWLSRRRYQLR